MTESPKTESMKGVRVRVAPSPTGFFHMGTFRTALFNYLFARQHGGTFLLRVEDTDRARLVEGSMENIVQSLADFGIAPTEGVVWEDGQVTEKGDRGPYTQSARLDIYGRYVKELLEKKAAYRCFCTPERLDELRKSQEAQKLAPRYDKHCLSLKPEEAEARVQAGERHVVRLNVPAGQVIRFTDLVHGEISISTNNVDDQVLVKSDGFPTYHLAVVIDDHLMGITHVMRGDEWVPSTPKHILLYQALGWAVPEYVHLPLLLSKTRKKLSKREGDVAVRDFLAKGYLREALINFVAFLGWNPKTEQEIFSLEDLVREFDVRKINKAGAVFDLDKLDWINGLYIRKLGLPDLTDRCLPYLKSAGFMTENYPPEFLQAVVSLERERMKKLSEIGERVGYMFTDPDYPAEMLVWKKSDMEAAQRNLQAVYSHLHKVPAEQFTADALAVSLKKLIADSGLTTGEVLWPLRVALSGLEASPGPFEIMGAFGTLPNGKETVLRRVTRAIEKL